ncbi:MAG: dipeptide ABC transporter ATP-binding protein, partial [Microvirga sp.]
IASGEILFGGRNLLTLSAAKRREINGKRIAMVFQDPLSHLNPVYTVGWQLREIMRVHGVPAPEAASRALDLMRRVGIPDPAGSMDKYPHQFSGGQRQRIMIAMALANKPDIVIADEPTTALDVTVQAEVLRLLEELQAEMGMGVLLITHDLGVVADVADRVVVMNAGGIVEAGTPSEIYHHAKHPYTRKLIAAAPGRGEMNEPGRGGTPILKVENACKTYADYHALKNVSFELMKGETLAVVGESGSGKSTVAKAILRLIEADSGKALWKGRDLFTMPARELYAMRRKIQMVFQDPTQSLNPRMSIYQIISEAWVIHPEILPKARWRDRVAELLVQVGLQPEHAARYPHQFSGGQRQRIAIARALALEPEMIIADEAVSALDVSIQAQVIALLDRLKRELGIAFIFIAHDLPVVRDFADHVMVMERGRVVEQGTVREIFENPREPYTRRLLAAGLDPDPDVQRARRIAEQAVTV